MTVAAVRSCAVLLLAALAFGQESAPATRADAAPLPGTAEGGWREFRGDPRNLGVSHGPAPSFTGIKWRFLADSAILNSPAVDAGVAYFGSRSGRLFAVRTKDGSKIWEKAIVVQLDPEVVTPAFTYSSPLLFRGRVYIGCEDGNLYCCDQKTGDVVWKRHLGGTGQEARIWAAPKTDGKNVLLGSLAGRFWAFDPDDGAVRWSVKTEGGIGASAAILGGEIFIPSGDQKLRAIDAVTGQVRWETDLGSGSNSSPTIRLGCAFLRASGGKVLCVDLVSRGVRWTAQLSSSTYSTTHPAHDGDRVYVTQSITVTAFDTTSGDEKWQSKVRAAYDSSPIVVGPWVVAAAGDQAIHAFDRKTGAEVKTFRLSEGLKATPTIVDGVAYVPGATGTLFAVE